MPASPKRALEEPEADAPAPKRSRAEEFTLALTFNNSGFVNVARKERMRALLESVGAAYLAWNGAGAFPWPTRPAPLARADYSAQLTPARAERFERLLAATNAAYVAWDGTGAFACPTEPLDATDRFALCEWAATRFAPATVALRRELEDWHDIEERKFGRAACALRAVLFPAEARALAADAPERRLGSLECNSAESLVALALVHGIDLDCIGPMGNIASIVIMHAATSLPFVLMALRAVASDAAPPHPIVYAALQRVDRDKGAAQRSELPAGNVAAALLGLA